MVHAMTARPHLDLPTYIPTRYAVQRNMPGHTTATPPKAARYVLFQYVPARLLPVRPDSSLNESSPDIVQPRPLARAPREPTHWRDRRIRESSRTTAWGTPRDPDRVLWNSSQSSGRGLLASPGFPGRFRGACAPSPAAAQ